MKIAAMIINQFFSVYISSRDWKSLSFNFHLCLDIFVFVADFSLVCFAFLELSYDFFLQDLFGNALFVCFGLVGFAFELELDDFTCNSLAVAPFEGCFQDQSFGCPFDFDCLFGLQGGFDLMGVFDSCSPVAGSDSVCFRP